MKYDPTKVRDEMRAMLRQTPGSPEDESDVDTEFLRRLRSSVDGSDKPLDGGKTAISALVAIACFAVLAIMLFGNQIVGKFSSNPMNERYAPASAGISAGGVAPGSLPAAHRLPNGAAPLPPLP
jgi:hypothetical protein